MAHLVVGAITIGAFLVTGIVLALANLRQGRMWSAP